MLSTAKSVLSGRLMAGAVIAMAVAFGASHLRADGPAGQSFSTLAMGFTQELVGISADLQDPEFGILGGVAFAPNGDVWSSECVFDGTRLHRFHLDQPFVNDHATTLHQETVVSATQGGCGLTNHPDGALYSNSSAGIWKLDADTGAPLGDGPRGPGGNALGIAVDPQDGHHLVYVGSDCHPSLTPDSTTCTLWDLNQETGVAGVFARLTRSESAFLDGIYFDPSGEYLFGAHRDDGVAGPNNSLQIIRRPAVLGAPDMAPDDTQIAQEVAMDSEPDGVAFHATQGFVVTLDESDGGTMTRFDFPGANYAAAPVQSGFAGGGFRGDLLQVGPDGCVYGTQGALFQTGGISGVRFDDGFEEAANSIVKICGGFAIPPGVSSPGEGQIGDFVWEDVNQDGLQDSGEPGIGDLEVTLSGPDGTETTTTDGSGHYLFTGLKAGSYAVTVTQPPTLVATTSGVGADRAIDSNGSPATVSLETNTSEDLTIDFGYHARPATLAGFAYVDANRNGVKDVSEDGIPGVLMTLAGPTGGTQVTGPDGDYQFTQLIPGDYTVTSPDIADGKHLSTPSPLSATLAADEHRTDVNFGYVPGSLAGYAYVDVNRNGMRDSGEPGIGGVSIGLTGPSSASATTAADGAYLFEDLDAGPHQVSAPGSAAGKSRSTASPLDVDLAAGEDRTDVNFGYVPGSISGFAYVDSNRNTVKDSGEAVLGGVLISLAAGGTATTAGDGTYSFSGLDAGSHSVSAEATASGKALFTTSPLSVNLGAGEARTDVNFGYVPGSISGFAYVDANRNSVKDSGEAVLNGVPISLAGGGTTTTAGDGSYTFDSLNAGSHSVSAAAAAGGKALFTTSPLSVNLGAGETRTDVNFGYVPGGLSGFAYVDGNRNGVKDGTEPGIGGVSITLGGVSSGTTVTAANGSYSFTELDAGAYNANAPASASGKQLFTTSPLSVTLAAGQNQADVNFGYVPGGLSGFAYVDGNRNGVKDGSEPGIGGVSITLGGASSGTTMTAADGSYSFNNLDAGGYNASAPASASGKQLFTSSPLSVTLAAGQNQPNVNFGYVPGSVSGFAYVDLNSNGVKDGSEPGIPGVSIVLDGTGSTVFATSIATTIADGSYSFIGLDAGTYSDAAPATAAGKNRSTASPLAVSLVPGQDQANVNFGYVPGGLSGFAYIDGNRNGVKDGSEPGIGGVSITLGGASSGTTMTAADGSYSFNNLDAGGYSVSAPASASGKQLFTTSPLSVTLTAGQNQPNVNFGYVPGGLSGFAYLDVNHNSSKDVGEAGIGGVTITLAGGGTRTTAGDGSYAFSGLDAGSYSVAAPASAGPNSLFTASPLAVTLAPGQTQPNVNFGYVSPNPGATLTKTANPTTYNAPGQVIVYTYVIQNTGDVPLSGPFTITDDKLGSFQCGTATSLAPGASLTCTRSYTIQASDLGAAPNLPTGVVANVDTGAWLQGVMSTQDTTISGAGPGLPDGVYPGWCIQDHVIVDLHNQPGTLYSTIGGNLPADVANLAWGKVNYVLNHKIRGAGKSDLAFFKDVQTAVWVMVGEPNPEFGISASAQQMIDAANAHPNFVPGYGDVVAVIIYSDGMGTNPNTIQESIIEVKPYQSITNHATATGTAGSVTLQTTQVQATVTQAPPPAPPPVPTAPMDVIAWGHKSSAATTVTTSAFTTTAGSELLLAFVSADAPSSGTNTTVTGVTGAGLTWQLVKRTNVQRGTAEIWRAFASAVLSNVTVTATLSQSVASSLTVVSMTGVDTSGTYGSGAIGATASNNGSSGAPTISLTTTRANSWVFGVGTDWDNPIARTVGANQAMVHQYMPPVGDTYWVQRIVNAIPSSGTLATLNDTAPTTDRWNFAAVEVLQPGAPPQMVTVPSVVNMTQSSASSAIVAATLTTGTVSNASSSSVPAGKVISQSPSGGSQAAQGSAVALVVSSGPALVTVPNAVNLTQSAASTAINNAGLAVGTVTTASSSTVPSGSVISQNPAAGTQVAPGSAVALVVSSGSSSSAPTVDKVVFSDGNGNRTTSAFSTTSGNQLLLGFVATDGPTSGGQTATVSGAGLTWTLVKRANTRLGSSEIWKATAASQLSNVTVTSTQTKTTYHQSLTVVTFKGASGVGASASGGAVSGAPSVSLTTTKANALVYGVGNDWDTATARTLGSNQTMVHQWVDTGVGDTFWVQSRSSAIANAGTSVQINDTAPTADQWNLAIVEIVP